MHIKHHKDKDRKIENHMDYAVSCFWMKAQIMQPKRSSRLLLLFLAEESVLKRDPDTTGRERSFSRRLLLPDFLAVPPWDAVHQFVKMYGALVAIQCISLQHLLHESSRPQSEVQRSLMNCRVLSSTPAGDGLMDRLVK